MKYFSLLFIFIFSIMSLAYCELQLDESDNAKFTEPNTTFQAQKEWSRRGGELKLIV